MLPVLAVSLASILAIGGINAWLSARQTRHRIVSQLNGVADVLTKSNFPLTEPVLRQMQQLSGAEFALVRDGGSLAASTLNAGFSDFPSPGSRESHGARSLESTITIEGRDYFHWPLQLPRAPVGGSRATLHILFPCDEYQRAIRSAMFPPLAVSILSTAAVVVVAQLIANRVGKTTNRLGREVERLARGDYTPATVTSRDDELRDLTVAVNDAAGRMAEYHAHVRHTEQLRTLGLVGAGLAHEMRNAATGCRMALDLHAEECCVGSGETLEVARRQLTLIESSLRRLLQLGKPSASSAREVVNLSEIVDEAISLVKPAAKHHEVTLQWNKPQQEIIASLDRDAIHQVVLNLALNAIESVGRRASPSALERLVRIELRRLEGDSTLAELCILDSGAGPKESLAESLFQPFVTSKPEGVGIGLAVVRQIVDAHQGDVYWNRADGMTRFCVVLPATQEQLNYV